MGDSIELQGLKINLIGEGVTSQGDNITINGSTIINSSTGTLTFNSTSDSSGSYGNFVGGDIAFGNTIDGYSAGTQSLNFIAGEGNIIVVGAIGSNAIVKDLTIDSALTFTAFENISSDGHITFKVISYIYTANLSTNSLSKVDISLVDVLPGVNARGF